MPRKLSSPDTSTKGAWTTKESARYLNISVSTFWRHQKRGIIPRGFFYVLGGPEMYRPRVIEGVLEKLAAQRRKKRPLQGAAAAKHAAKSSAAGRTAR